jgi:diacylglycerol O-acyltransferase / wax synthase
MDPLPPLGAAMMTAELLSDPLHTTALLILSPPREFVDELYQDALTSAAELDPRFLSTPARGRRQPQRLSRRCHLYCHGNQRDG